MASFSPSKKQASDFNNGVEYVNGKNTVNANDINNLIEAVLYAQEVNNQQDYQGLPMGGNQGDILIKQGAENYKVVWSDILTKLNVIVNQNSETLSSLSKLVETDEAGNTYIYSKDKLTRVAIFNTNDSGEVAHIQLRDNLEQDFRTIQRLDKDFFVISNKNGDDIFNAQNGSLELYNNILNKNGEFVDQETIFQANEDGVFHRGDILLKHKDIESLEDKVDENALKSHTNQLEITNLKNALYGSVLSLETDSNADLDKAILSDSVTVDEQVYPIVDNTRALLSEVSGKTVKFNQLLDKSKYPATAITYDVTYTNNNDGTVTVNGTASGLFQKNILGSRKVLIQNHKYLLKGCPSGGNFSNSYSLVLQDYLNGAYQTEHREVGAGLIFTPTADFDENRLIIRIVNGTTVENLVFKPQLYDLTAMGLDHITTVEEFNALFPNEMYEYDSGSLKTAEIASVKLYETDGVTLSGEITFPSKQTLNGVNNIKDKLVVTKNEDNDYYTLKKIVNVGSGTILPSGEENYLTDGNGNYVYPLATPTEEVISSTLILEQVSAMRKNGGLIEVVGNDNAIYNAKPTVDLTVICEQPAKYVPVSGNETEY